MFRALVLLLAPLSGQVVAVEHAAGSLNQLTPLQTVVNTLNGMLSTCQEGKHTEEVEFVEFKQWCDSTKKATSRSISEGASQIEQLQADIQKAVADAEDLSQEADELSATATTDQAEADKATGIRKTEKTDFESTNTDFSESIDAIERAISVLQSRKADVPQSLLQMVRSAKMLPVETKRSLEGLLALKSLSNNEGTPKANAYEFQSGASWTC